MMLEKKCKSVKLYIIHECFKLKGVEVISLLMKYQRSGKFIAKPEVTINRFFKWNILPYSVTVS